MTTLMQHLELDPKMIRLDPKMIRLAGDWSAKEAPCQILILGKHSSWC